MITDFLKLLDPNQLETLLISWGWLAYPVLARFIPIIRTFAPFVAGMASMPYSTFASFNVFGGIGWVTSMTLSGYFLGNISIIKHNFEKTVLVIIFLSILPLLRELWAHWR